MKPQVFKLLLEDIKVCPMNLAASILTRELPESIARMFFFSLLLSSLELSDTKVYEPYIRALLGTGTHA